MTRKHIRKPGTAVKRNYLMQNLELALEAVIDEGTPFSQAELRFGVPKATIWKKYRGITRDKLGRPTVLSLLEEKHIVDALLIGASYGHPFDKQDLKLFIQQYLNRKGVDVKCFKENMPGDEWVNNFQNRHKDLTRRNCENMKRVKAALTPDIIRSYFTELQISINGVPPENVINYDETNISDDPGKTKIFTKKGCKHPTRIMDSSKSSHSIMFAVTGDGSMLPPYIVYKAKNLYPELHRKKGRKLLIGDNLVSHLSLKIIQACEQNEINFVFLPTNSTHICQPLDVAVFGPMKKAWRKTLTAWKTRNKGVVPKTEFPGLLGKMLQTLEPTLKDNIKNGFAGCGIIPLDPERVLKKIIPQGNTAELDNAGERALVNSFNDIMANKTVVPESRSRKRQKKIDVVPGKSVSVMDFERTSATTSKARDNNDKEDSDLDELQETEEMNEIESSDEDVIAEHNHEEAVAHTNSDLDYDTDDEKTDKNLKTDCYKPTANFVPFTNVNELKIDSFAIVTFVYNKNTKKEHFKNFLGKAVEISNGTVKFSFLRPHKGRRNSFVFPAVEDLFSVNPQQIKYLVSQSVICRGIHTFHGDVL